MNNKNKEVTIEPLPENVKLEEDNKPKKQYTPQQMVDRLWLILKATNDAVESLHKKLDAAAVENRLLAEQRDRAMENMNKQMQTTQNAIKQHSDKEASMTSEVRKIHEQVRNFGGDKLIEIADDVVKWRDNGREENKFAEHTEWLLQTIKKFKRDTR